MITEFHMTAYKTPEERKAASRLPVAKRQFLIDHLLVQYPLFDDGVKFISTVHMPVEGGTHGKGMIAGLLGRTRAGKSDICKFYCNKHPLLVTDTGKQVPVMYVGISTNTTPISLAEMFYLASQAESWPKMKTTIFVRNSVSRVVRAGAQLVILDDAQFMFLNRPKNIVRDFVGILKQLADTKAFNVLLVGEESIYEFIFANDMVAERGGFPKQYIAPLSEEDDEFEMFRMLLQKVDRRLPFAFESGLAAQHTATDLYRYSGGVLGKVMNLVRAAALRALNADAPRILRTHLFEEAAMRQRPGDSYDYFARGD